jgi:hypothetical protein
MWAQSNSDSDDPSLVIPQIDKDEPIRKNDLHETAEPIWMWSKTLKDEPNLLKPYTLKDEPILINDLKDRPLPAMQ